MITLASLRDVDFLAAAGAALLGALLVLLPELAPLRAMVAPEVCFGFAGGAAIRWALRQPPALPPAPPAMLLGLGSSLEPRGAL